MQIRPAYVGICGSGRSRLKRAAEAKGNSESEYLSHMKRTDLHEYLDGPAFFPTKPHPLTGEKLPIVLGHEFSGTVVEVGADVSDIHVGQKVAVLPPFYDHTCGACVKGMLNCCESIGAIGCSGKSALRPALI
jgi:threonine dehydrogenase-like Zn-dependent dehydrogenase